jgi:uncharacterized repeat protein (TIGR01451 family)
MLVLAWAAAPLLATDLISCAGDSALLGATGSGASDDLTRAALSGDGTRVAFASKASNLVPGEDNAYYDVYVRDLLSGTTVRASTGLDGADSDGDSSRPALSGDGRFVVFASSATNLVAGDTNGRADIFRKDLQTGTIVRVSTSGSSVQATRDSGEPAVNGDGRYVAFTSQATNLIGSEADGFRDVYVKDLVTGAVTCASAGAGGHGDYDSTSPSISADGRFVAFESSATNLIPGYTPQWHGVYVKDLQSGAISCASTGAAGGEVDGGAAAPALSLDGRFVSFESVATNLAAGCVHGSEGLADVFVKDLQTGEVSCASRNASGAEANAACYRPSSPDGRRVLFESVATNLVDGYAYSRSHIFLKDLLTGTVVRASNDGSGAQALDNSSQAAMSADARFVAFVSLDHGLVAGDLNGLADVFVKDLATEAVVTVSARDPAATVAPAANNLSSSGTFSVSRDGRFVAFWSRATDIVPGDTNGVADIFVRDRSSGTTIRANTAADGTQADAMGGVSALSADGRHLAFTTFATNLVPGATNGTQHVYVKDLQTGSVVRASTAADGALANGLSTAVSASGDGRYVSFASSATNLVGGDTNGVGDIFVKDLLTGAVVRASTGSDGGEANNYSAEPAMSADGRWVAFRSGASNLVAGDTGAADIFVKDLQTGAIVRASTNGSGAQADGSSALPSLSADGRFVAFQSAATNLVSYDTGGKVDIFVKDLQTGVVQRASTTGSGVGSYTDSSAPCISDDGRYVVFEGGGINLVDGSYYAVGNIFLKDLQTQEIVRLNGSLGVEEPAVAKSAAISGDGRHVAFTSTAGNLVANDGNHVEDVFHVAIQADLRTSASGTATVTAGKTASFWFTVENKGPCVAHESVVSVAVPEGTTFEGAWANRSGWSVTAPPVGGRGTILISRASLLLGDVHVLSVRVRIDPDLPEGGLVTCTARAETVTGDPTPENLASWASIVQAPADLSVSVEHPLSIAAGSDVAYTVRVTNAGPHAAEAVTLDVALPAGVQLASHEQIEGPAFTLSAPEGRIRDTIPTLAPGAAAAIAVVAHTDPGLSAGSILEATAGAVSTTIERDASDNSVVVATTVTAEAALEAQLEAPATAVAGTGFTLTASLTNRGPSDARVVRLAVTLPDGVRAASWSQGAGPLFSLSGVAPESFADIVLLPAGATASFVLGATVSPGVAEAALLQSVASAAAETPAPVSGENLSSCVAETLTETRADVSVTLEAPGTITGCTGLGYAVAVTNRGPSDARLVNLTLEVPVGVTITSYGQASGPAFTLAGGERQVTGTIAQLPAGAGASFAVETHAEPSLTDGLDLLGVAAVSTTTTEVAAGVNQHRVTATTAAAFANQPPLAHAGGGYRVLVGRGVTLDGSGSTDPDAACGDTITSWEWDVNGDGAYGDAVGSAAELSWEQVQGQVCGGACVPGSAYPVALRVTDGGGLTGEDAATLTVDDELPHALARALPNPVPCPDAVTLEGSGSLHGDPTRTIVRYEWDFEYDGVTFTPDATGATVSHAYGEIGERTAALRVTDDSLPPRTDLASVVVKADGSVPVADAGGPYLLAEGQSVVLNASGSTDPDAGCGDRIGAYAWDLDGDGRYDDAEGRTLSLTWDQVVTRACGGACALGAPYPVGVQVTDRLGYAATAVSTLTVSAANVPVRLASPNGGELLGAGQPHAVRWVAAPDVDLVRVYLSSNGATGWVLLFEAPAAAGTYDWSPVPATFATTRRTCRLMIDGYRRGVRVGRDLSDRPFGIGAVDLTSPDGGEKLVGGGTHLLTWDVFGTAADMVTSRVQYTVNGGVTWVTAATLAGNPGRHDWTVPAPARRLSACRVRVLLYGAAGRLVGLDQSQGAFAILGRVDVTEPELGDAVYGGTSRAVTWTTNTSLPVATVVLRSTVDNGVTWRTVATLPGNPGSYSWKVPRTTIPRRFCRIMVFLRTANGAVVASDGGEGYFTLLPLP